MNSKIKAETLKKWNISLETNNRVKDCNINPSICQRLLYFITDEENVKEKDTENATEKVCKQQKMS